MADRSTNVRHSYSKFFFSGIAFESSKIKKNYIFFAIKGNNFDGNDFIPLAIKKGSRIIITEKKIKKKFKGILFIYTKNVRKLLAEISFKIYKNLPKNLIAITGTPSFVWGDVEKIGPALAVAMLTISHGYMVKLETIAPAEG